MGVTEIWAFEDTIIIEKLQNEFLMFITNSNNQRTNGLVNAHLKPENIPINLFD